MCPAAHSGSGGGVTQGGIPVKKIAVRVAALGGGIVAVLLAGGAWRSRLSQIARPRPCRLSPTAPYRPAVPKNDVTVSTVPAAACVHSRRSRSPRSSARRCSLVQRYSAPDPGAARRALGARGLQLATASCGCRTACSSRAIPMIAMAAVVVFAAHDARCSAPLLVGAVGGGRTSRRCAAGGGAGSRSTSGRSGSRIAGRRVGVRARCPTRSSPDRSRRAARRVVPTAVVYVVVRRGRCSLLSYVDRAGAFAARGARASSLPTAPQMLPFALLGFLLGRLYLALGAGGDAAHHRADPHRARDVRVVPAREGVARRDGAAAHPRARAEGSVHRRSRRSGSRCTPATSARSSTSCRPALERLRFAALMHDIGKLVVPNQLLNKPGKLTEEEFARVRIHEGVSVQMLSHIDFLRPIALHTHSDDDALRPRRPRSSDRAVHHHGRRRVRRDDLDPLVPQGAAAGGRVPGAARQVGDAVPPRVRRGAHPRDREAQRGARQGPRGRLALRGRARGRAWARPVSATSLRRDETGEASEPAAAAWRSS